MKPIRMLSALILATLLLSASLAAAFTPATLSYQGSLYDNNKLPVTGVKDMRFQLYHAVDAAESAKFWGEPLTSVNVTNGRFAVNLGNTTPLNPGDFQGDVWVGIKVGTDNEMTPRQKLTSVAFALNADNGVPVGGIIMWSGAIASIPAGWQLCDGTNSTPDLRGRFVIGAGGTYAKGATGGNEKHFHKASGENGDLRAMVGTAADGVSMSSVYASTYNPNTNVKMTNTARAAHGSGWNDEPVNSFTSVVGFTSQGFLGSPVYGSNGTAVEGSLPPYYALAYIMRTK